MKAHGGIHYLVLRDSSCSIVAVKCAFCNWSVETLSSAGQGRGRYYKMRSAAIKHLRVGHGWSVK